MQQTVTGKLGEWAARMETNHIPAAVRNRTAIHIMDTAGLRLAGAKSSFARLISEVFHASQQVTSDAGNAHFRALENAALATCLDYDDTHRVTLIHPTVPAVMAAFEAARETNCSGADLVASTALGVEIACRIAAAAPGAFHARGLNPTGILAIFGSAVAASRLLGANGTQIATAISIAAGFGSGLMQPFSEGNDSRYFYSANAAANGLLAARLALAGIDAPKLAIEGDKGLFAALLDRDFTADFNAVTSSLGQKWESDGILLKQYPTGFVAHPFIDAVFAIPKDRREHVAEIHCAVPRSAVRLICEPLKEKINPASTNTARVSLYHILAEALHIGQIDASSFSDDHLANPDLRLKREKMTYHVIDENKRSFLKTEKPHIRVSFEDNAEDMVILVKEKAMDLAATRAKFVSNTERELGRSESERQADLLLNIEASERGSETLRPFLEGGAR